MNVRLCSSSSELSSLPFVEGLHHPNINLKRDHVEPFNTAHCAKNTTVSYTGGRKGVLSKHVIPRHVEESFIVEKQLEEPPEKLEYVRTLLIDNYDSYTYNIYQQLSTINGVPPVVIRNDSRTWEEIRQYLYEENVFDNIVISPGPGSPTCPADIGICLQLLLECSDIPILGVCLGHQALGYVHGAEVVHASEPVHGRLSEIEHDGCRLFSGIPSGRNSGFKVVRYHSLVIDPETLPKELVPIAWTSCTNPLPFFENQSTDNSLNDPLSKVQNGKSSYLGQFEAAPNTKVLMGIRHSTRPHFGVQFHPESIATSYGSQIFKNFREITEDYWTRSQASSVRRRNADYAGNRRLTNMQVPSIMNNLLKRVSVLEKKPWMDINGDYLPQLYDGDEIDCFSVSNKDHPINEKKSLKLRWKKFDRLASRVGGADNIFCEIFAERGAKNTFWLDSASIEKGRARFSFMGAKGGPLWKQLTFRLSDKSGTATKVGGNLLVEDYDGHTSSFFLEDGFFDFLNRELLSFHYEEKDFAGLPFDFHGGYVGYIGYDLKLECGVASNRHKSQAPDACFFFADNFLVIDHLNEDVYMMSLYDQATKETSWLDETEQKLLRLKPRPITEKKTRTTKPSADSPTEFGFYVDKSRDQYKNDVEKCLEYIKDGESYELCLTTQLRKEIGQINSLGLYLYLRESNPAPYAAWLNFASEKLCVCCSSPERFLQLDRNGTLEAKPIKGTIARGTTEEDDGLLKMQLQYSEKDQAENLMIVDLLRNDLGRVCEPGSVHVPNLMVVESYATVHTMVSTIRGKKRPNVSGVDCVRAAFPGGSMTGAPKLRSMELLDSLESCSRGIYSGSIGFFSINQTFDLNIVIRTVVIHEAEASVGAGGAIVALSNPEDEYEEMRLKTRAPVKAVLQFEDAM
ncbi:hypothetical protein CDL15_Pgr026030 [Punica granatum]|uniref:aminodeoxychorismate synthase n=1 Tax=Punica granatum TaxID=22663 RepID=A0A218WCW6_PUNGR|nr:hypothetical protein CDL15_Pgr026030 [Punica granatum]